MNKKLLALIAVIGLAGAAIFYWFYHHDRDDGQGLTLYGNVDIRQVSLAFENAGRVQQMYVQEGDRVKAGQVLASLNTDALRIQAEQAAAQLEVQKQNIDKQDVGTRPEEIAQVRAQIASAEAQLDKANKDFSRMQTLMQNTAGQAISKQELDSARTNQSTAQAALKEREAYLKLLQQGAQKEDRKAAKAQYNATQANLELIQYQIKQSELRAPTAATVRARLLEPGDMAAAQKSVYTLALTDPKWVRVYASEKELGQIKMGMPAQVIRDSAPNQPVQGKVGYISSVAEFTPKTVQTEDIRTSLVYEVRIYVQDANDQLKMGQPVTVKLTQNCAAADCPAE